MNSFRPLSLIALAAVATSGFAAWSTGTIAVVQMGDGITPLTSATASVKLLELNRLTGVPTGEQVDLTYNGTTGITLTGNTTGEGGMNVTQNIAVIGGYPLIVGSASASSSTGRRVLQVDLTGVGSLGTAQDLPIAGGQIRDAVLFSGVNFAISTASLGVQTGYFGLTSTSPASTETNTRYLTRPVWNESVGYSTTGGGNYVVKEINTGDIWLDAIAAGIIVADFSISNDGLTMYLASDAVTTSTGGLWRFTRPDTTSPFSGLTGVRIYSGSAVRHVTLYEAGGHQVFATHRSGATSFVSGFLNAASLPASSSPSWTVNAAANTVFLGISAIPLPPIKINGTVNLQDYVGSLSGPLFDMTVHPAGSTTTVASVPVFLSPSGTFTRTLSETLAPGNYDLYLDGSPWLKRKVGNLNLVSGNNSVTFTLFNGDVDDSTEVDAVDIDLVIAHFGDTPSSSGWLESADVDGSQEVDAVDIDIVIANFGRVDD